MSTTFMPSPERIAVVGGGAAGMMAASRALACGAQVTIFEPNKSLGCKLYITGKGRCNLTNDCSVPDFLPNVLRNARFLYSALSAFSPADTVAYFTERGVPLKTERGRRVFPVSDRAADVVAALERDCRGARRVRERVSALLTENGRVVGVKAAAGEFPFDAVILATGGCSYPRTGSDGNGYRLATDLGHTVTPLAPSLVPLESPDYVCGQMQGLSLKNVTLSIKDSAGKLLYRDFGEMLFTHFGISGPLVLSASAHLYGLAGPFTAVIDLKPALDEKTLDARLLADLAANPNRTFSNVLAGLLPSAMIGPCITRCGVAADTRANAVTREGRRRLLAVLKGFTLPITGPRPIEEAIVTAGGIAVREVEPKTLMSRKLPGLFFAGEMLDVDAYTGGYNLQIAFSTGQLAGESAVTYARKEIKV